MPYERIVFMQGDDANEPLDILYNREPGDTSQRDGRTDFILAHCTPASEYRLDAFLRVLAHEPGNEPLPLPSVAYHGPTAESVAATLAYLRQWDSGDPSEQSDSPSSGTSDDAWEQDGYRMSAHLGLGYIGLERIVPDEPGAYNCPCCGYVAMTDDTGNRPPCAECQLAGCEPTTDACGDTGYRNCARPDLADDALADEITRQAAKLGREAGIAAASWIFDGSTSQDTYRTVLRGIDEGDPAVLDGYRTPDLSGEFAGDPTPDTLADELGIPRGSDVLDDACEAWEEAASEAFWHEVERIARVNLT